jgi:isoleucyl-tRNA synthetase
VYKTFGPTSPGQLLPATSSSPQTYILSYPGIAFKFPVPNNAPTSPTDKALLNVLHKNEPPCLASSLVIFAGNSWAEARAALTQPRLRTKAKKGKKQDKSSPEDTDQLDFAEIVPNDRVILTFQSGNTVTLTYGIFTAQDAVTLLGPPSEVYTKSDTRLNIHNGHSRSEEIDSGPLSEGTSHRASPFLLLLEFYLV